MADSIAIAPAHLEERDAATIGLVEAVSPRLIDIAVLTEAPHGTGLREGAFHRFPRINSYVVLPSERGSILAMVVWLGIEDEHGLRSIEADRIGLPLPRRKLKALPLGVLKRATSVLDGDDQRLSLDRGVLLFPTVGDPARLPTKAEAAAAVPTHEPDAFTLHLGSAPLASDTEVRVDPNKMFGRHLAVLGNTGSGKSCSVASLIRSSVLATEGNATSFRAVVLDMNGEYETAFDDLGDNVQVRRFAVTPTDGGIEQLRVPAWLWNYREWLAFSDASTKSQAPQLRRALHLLRTQDVSGAPRPVVSLIAGRRQLQQFEAAAVSADRKKDALAVLDDALDACQLILDDGPNEAVDELQDALQDLLEPRRGDGQYRWTYDPDMVKPSECAALMPIFDEAISKLGVPEFLSSTLTVDDPLPFDPLLILELLPWLAAADPSGDASSWIAPLVERLRISLADERLLTISGWKTGESLADWLDEYVGAGATNQITVIDLSLVPSHVLHLVAAVLARLLLEALERHRRYDHSVQLPTILVVEEAHGLIPRRTRGGFEEEAVNPAQLCRGAFERIAREGRKFGLSLVISSQRPSELSETVLSQCNTFLIHRIVNDHDQDLIRRLVPDALGTLTEELPALPSQVGLLVGWAIEVPTLIRIADLDVAYQPRSADPDFGGTWRGDSVGTADWGAVAASWAGIPAEPDDGEAGEEVENAGEEE